MKRLIRKILREQLEKSDRHYHMLDKISNYGELPYFKSMEALGIYDKDDQEYIMRKILGNGITIRGRDPNFYVEERYIYDDEGNMISQEDFNGWWQKWEYDDNGNLIHSVDSDGSWKKWEYDDKGNKIYFENNRGSWSKYEYDDNGNQTYYENNRGYWEIQEFDDKGNVTYVEDSNGYRRWGSL
jgi:YD repeat-containing protein